MTKPELYNELDKLLLVLDDDADLVRDGLEGILERLWWAMTPDEHREANSITSEQWAPTKLEGK